MSSKRFRSALALVDQEKQYSLEDGVALVKQTATTKFDSSIEVHVRLGIDPSKADQMVRSTAQLPKGTGKKLRIAVFAKGAAAKAAKEAGADLVGDDDLIAEIKKTSKLDFDIAIATPDMMKSLAPVAKTLGTKGLMPNPKNDTVSADPAAAVKSLQTGKIAFRSDSTGNVHQMIGKASFSTEDLKANLEAFLDALKRAKSPETKGTYIRSITLTSSMGPGITLTTN
ncbi:MAG: 50S ribosomal protein L1 [Candidatus Kerfeldbacteria bacterium]|nr:50S ribosomal protein L1 [Candidatus Kerfeldbacteria bacterium]